MNLSTRQWEAHIWLSRMWGKDNDIESYEKRKDEIISQLSGIGKYDSDFVPAQTGENSVETKNIEYSLLCEKIDKLIKEIAVENVKTMAIIDKVTDELMHRMIYDRYINRLSWSQIGIKYNYAQRQPYRYMHKCLDEIRQYIPEDEIKEVVYGKDVCSEAG